MDVPPDFDPHTRSAEEMRALYRDLHAGGCPVFPSSAHGGFHTVSSHPQLRAAAADWETFSSAGGVLLPKAPFRNAALEYDPPEHTYWRALFRHALGVGEVRAAEPAVRRDAAGLIDGFAARGTAELVGELAETVPGNTICRIIGITDPERIRLGCRLGIRLAQSGSDPDEAQAALGAFAGFCAEEVEARRADPRDDYITRLATAENEGRRLTDGELVGLLIGFFFAGHHTTTAGLAALFSTISRDPHLRDRLVADPGLIPRAAEEAVRLETPLHGFYRQPTREVEVQGVPLAAGSEVWLNYAAGNRDPQVFPEPDEFRLDRRPNPHLGFGHGIHVCVGAALARMEMRVVTEELLSRLPDLTTTGEPVERRWGGGNVMSIARVPVVFTPSAPEVHEVRPQREDVSP